MLIPKSPINKEIMKVLVGDRMCLFLANTSKPVKFMNDPNVNTKRSPVPMIQQRGWGMKYFTSGTSGTTPEMLEVFIVDCLTGKKISSSDQLIPNVRRKNPREIHYRCLLGRMKKTGYFPVIYIHGTLLFREQFICEHAWVLEQTFPLLPCWFFMLLIKSIVVYRQIMKVFYDCINSFSRRNLSP